MRLLLRVQSERMSGERKKFVSADIAIKTQLPIFFPPNDNLINALDECLTSALRKLAGNFPDSIEIGIILTDDSEITDLNRTYLGNNKPTDVLSFPLFERGELSGGEIYDVVEPIGDIVISIDTIIKQAQERAIPADERFIECLVHGFLHLLGFDHIEEIDRIEMENIEDSLIPVTLDIFRKYSKK